MAYPNTEGGYNMFDMLSMIQKAIRRGDYEYAGFAANQLRGTFRTAMWNRLLVISAEDCFGVITKELISLRKCDECSKKNQNIGNIVALMCRAKKSRDACYFACNFVLASRKPRNLKPSRETVSELYRRTKDKKKERSASSGKNARDNYDTFGFLQMSIFSEGEKTSPAEIPVPEEEMEKVMMGACLQMALKHRDMDMIGYEMDMLRRSDREFLWDVLVDYSESCEVRIENEILALKEADDIVNKRKKTLEKDEIFISKAAVLLCHCEDPAFGSVCSSDIVSLESGIYWPAVKVKAIEDCALRDGEIPEWVYDCHTLKGRKMGKTDWDMTTTEQAALYPLQRAYFDDASWIYTYEQDFENNAISIKGIQPIRKYAETHDANPVEHIPY